MAFSTTTPEQYQAFKKKELVASIRLKASEWALKFKVKYPGWYMVNKYMTDENILSCIGKCTTVEGAMEALYKNAVAPFLELVKTGQFVED